MEFAFLTKFKSENKISLKTFIEDLKITSNYADFVKSCEVDIKAVGSINNLEVVKGEFALEFGKIVEDEQ